MDGSQNDELTDTTAFPTPWTPVLALWVFFLQLGVVILAGGLLGTVASGLRPIAQSAALLLASSISGFALTLFVVWRRHPHDVWRLRGPRVPAWRDLGVGIAFGVVIYLTLGAGLGWLLTALVTAGGGELPEVQQNFRELASDTTLAPVFLVGAILLAPIAEELLYRGLLFQSLRSRLGAWPGIGLSAIVFGLTHLDPTVTLGGNLLVFTTIFALGMALAWSFDKTGKLAIPILAHVIFNLVNATLLINGAA